MNQAVKTAGGQSVIVQQNRGNITISIKPIVKDQKNVYPTVSFTFNGITDAPKFSSAEEDCNRVVSYSGFKNGYHPKCLTHFKKSGEGLPNPTQKKWQNITLNQQPQYVVFDLIQPPFEKQRRDYLSDRGSISYNSSKCKNENCPAYVKKESITPKEASTLIREANGKVILAHPVAYTYEDDLSDEEIINIIKDRRHIFSS